MKYACLFMLYFPPIMLIAQGQPPLPPDCACCTEAYQQFDFWLGDWVVYDTAGTQVGLNSITKLEDNCILSEHWRGAGGGTGRSYNYFNRMDSTWNQLWIDNKGLSLTLKGKAEKNRMTLRSERVVGKNGGGYFNQITWTKNEDGTVTQLWQAVNSDGDVVRTLFYGIYKRD